MSYCYEQHICLEGHRFDSDVVFPHQTICPTCGSGSGFCNIVNDYDMDQHGIILEESFNLFIIREEKKEMCNLQHLHTVPALYRIPSKKEVKWIRCRRNEHWVPAESSRNSFP